MLIGYMRVSSADERQSVDLQRDALIAAGVDERHLHQDRASGTRDDRPGLKACLADLRPGDVLVVWKLDRLGRSLSHLIRIIDEFKGRGVAFRSLTEAIDTTTAHGAFLFNLFGSLAEYERAPVTVEERSRPPADAQPPPEADDLDNLVAAAEVIPNDDADWERFNLVGMAFYAASGGSETGFVAFDLWGRKPAKCGPNETTAPHHFPRSPPSTNGGRASFPAARGARP